MSAETSRDKRDEELEKQIATAVKIGVPVLTISLALLGGMFVDVSTAILVLAAGALVGVIAMFWSSLRTLLGETPISGADAYAFGAPPRAEEEQKRAVLRALKDLEFERSVGKISEEDYSLLVAKYRAEAKRLLQLLDTDAAPRREKAEALVLKRLRKEGLLEDDAEAKDEIDGEEEAQAEETAPKKAEAVEEKPEEKADAEEKAEPAAKKKSKKKKKAGATKAREKAEIACAGCGTTNDEDALFCKKCGARVKDADASKTTDEEAGAS